MCRLSLGCESVIGRSERRASVGEERTIILLKREIRGEAEESGIGQFGKGTEIVKGSETDVSAAKGVDRFRLLETQVRMTRQLRRRERVDREKLNVSGVRREMV